MVSKKVGSGSCPPGVVAARMKPGTTGAIAARRAIKARQLMPFE
jgi:hypothetical protein